MSTYDAPEALAELLDRQFGSVSVLQLRSFGLARDLAQARVRAHRWRQLHRGVYLAFSGEPGREAQVWAAILRCGRGSVASHRTAAELDGLYARHVDEPIHITVDGTRRVAGRLDGVNLHYAHRLPLTRHPSRSVPRTRLDDTVLDLIDISRSAREAASWIFPAIQQRKTTPERLAARLASRKKIKWRAMIEAMLCRVADGANSMLEVHHHRRVVRAHGLPHGTLQQRRIADGRVIYSDVGHPAYRTRVELDGRVGHVADGAFRDRRRDKSGVVDGHVTLRYGHADVFGNPCLVAAEEAVVLQDRGWPGEPHPCSAECPIRSAMARLRRSRDATLAA